MNQILSRAFRVIWGFLASTKFFVLCLVVFIVGAGWLAFSAIYPQPFDEYYHYGIITIYAEQWSPFIHTQPLDASLYGDITRMTAYLYHYLMSFPFRLLQLISSDERFLITSLRFMNVAMVVGSILLFRKFFLENGLSQRMTNVILLAFMATPVVSLLAAEINYDNAMLLLMPICLLLAMRVIGDRGNLMFNTVAFAVVGLLTVMLKDTFAPIFIIMTVYLVAVVIWRYRAKLIQTYISSLKPLLKSWRFMIMCLLLVTLVGLATERYIGNKISYGSFRVDCEKVQEFEVCRDYMPWYRNFLSREQKPDVLPYDFGQYTYLWGDRMLRGYFATFSHSPSMVTSDREPFGPIILKQIINPSLLIGLAAFFLGLAAIVWKIKYLWDCPIWRFSLVLSASYVAVLFVFNYNGYLNLGSPQAIQARYTLPILPLIFGLMLVASSQIIRSPQLKLIGLLAVLGVFVITGGIVNRIVWADASWLWHDQMIIEISRSLRQAFRLVVNPY